MNILFVSSATTNIGISPFIKSQGESLKARGINLDYFTIDSKGMKGYLNGIGKLRKHLKTNKYDVIHAHYGLCGWVAVLALPGTPVVISFMGCDVYGDIAPDGKRTWYSMILLSKLLQPFTKAIIVKSRNLKDYIYIKKRVHLVPNGVNFNRFTPQDKQKCRAKLNLPADKKLVLFLGNPKDPRKNIELVKEALNRLNLKEIRLVAPYPVPHEEVAQYINAADVMVLASLMEGSPNVVKEAMACNCPVVATDVGDTADVIGNTAGCYVSQYDAADMAEKISRSLQFNGPTTGREDIAHLDETVIANKIIGIYSSIVKN